MMSVMIVWCLFPEEVEIYQVVVTQEEYKRILSIKGLYINQSGVKREEEDTILWIDEQLKNNADWHVVKLEKQERILHNGEVIVTGWIL